MIGALYLTSSIVSHIGRKLKELNWNVKAKIDPITNTYMDYNGKLIDYDSGQQRIYTIKSNGDKVLLDTKYNVIRNISKEKRIREYKYLKKTRSDKSATTYKTNEIRSVVINHPITRKPIRIKGTIYKDLSNGEEYFEIKQNVNKEYTHDSSDTKKKFYVLTSDPFNLIRISDGQRKLEQIRKDHGNNNWLDNTDKEKLFIRDYNSRPYYPDDRHDYNHLKSMLVNVM